VKREQDRLERQGKPFILGLARIDHFEDVSADYPEAETEAYVKLVSDLIKLSIRSFDEAYYVGEGKFVLVLKQASIKGGVFALERLRRELEDKNIIFRLKDGQAAMTMSCCLAEPAHSDKIDVLLENIEADLNTYPGKMSDTVLEYYEMSPLQRYMRESSGAR
jgi:PleD family two-component response regulator